MHPTLGYGYVGGSGWEWDGPGMIPWCVDLVWSNGSTTTATANDQCSIHGTVSIIPESGVSEHRSRHRFWAFSHYGGRQSTGQSTSATIDKRQSPINNQSIDQQSTTSPNKTPPTWVGSTAQRTCMSGQSSKSTTTIRYSSSDLCVLLLL